MVSEMTKLGLTEPVSSTRRAVSVPYFFSLMRRLMRWMISLLFSTPVMSMVALTKRMRPKDRRLTSMFSSPPF